MTRTTIKRLALFAVALSAKPVAAVPSWVKDGSFSIDGKIFKAACSGQGPSIGLARQEAVSSCKASASQTLQKQTKIRSMSIETENDVAFHQEVSDEGVYSNLNCVPEKEAVEEGKDGLWTVWVLCRVDLTKVDVGIPDKESATAPGSQVQTRSLTSVNAVPSASHSAKSATSGENKFINIVSVPPCSEILIKGPRARINRCDGTPVKILTYENDESLIVRARGYMPKTIELKGKSWVNYEIVQILLEAE